MNGAVLARDSLLSGETLRWMYSFTVVVGLHGGATLVALNWQRAELSAGAPPAVLLIDMSPAAPAPNVAPSPPVPEHRVETPPPIPEPEPLPKPLPEPEVALPEPVREVVTEPVSETPPQETPIEEPEEAVQETVASHPAIPAPAAAAPKQGESMLTEGAVATWQALLLAHLEKHKRYPREAQWLKQEGVVELYFAMNRAGRVLDARIETSSQSAALDREALELLVRAEPLPAPPAEVPDATFELIVPVEFALKR